ncbi:MAG: ParA family protein [Gemmatimonadetes bacterium]|nr:ParA family protein [Gemmatimonadota bacterium]
MRRIAIANQKGGVGKTTTAINVGACLAVAEKKTLLVDVDPQGNATSGLGVTRDEGGPTLYDVLTGGATMNDAVRRTRLPFLDLVPSHPDLYGAEIELLEVPAREHLLREALEPVAGEYEIVLIDCPPSLGVLTVNTLAAARSVLVPIQCEYYALEGLSQLLATVRQVQRHLNPQLEIEGLVLTMTDARLNLSKQVAAEAREYFGDKVYRTTIPRNVRLSEAPGFGKPILLYDAQSAGAEAYMNLTREMMQAWRTQEDGASAKG